MNLTREELRAVALKHGRGLYGNRALDIGVGESDWVDQLIEEGFEVTGMDPTRGGPDPEFGWADESFAVVTCRRALNQVSRPWEALREINRVLIPGGWLIGTAAFVWPADTDRDFWRFTPEGLDYWLGETGFTRRIVHTAGGPLSISLLFLRVVLRRLGASWLARWINRSVARVEAAFPGALLYRGWAMNLEFFARKNERGS